MSEPDYPHPTDLKLHQKSRQLEIQFDDGAHFNLTCEYLRVYSPSAEVRGHAPGEETLQLGKELVTIDRIEAVGSYGVKLFFDDGHHTGIYTWSYLYELGSNHAEWWQSYLDKLEDAGRKRQPVAVKSLKVEQE